MSILSRRLLRPLCILAATLAAAAPAAGERILFVGNSFTFGAGSPIRYFHSDLVHDLNRTGSGGVPALFRMFADQLGLDTEASVEAVAARDFAFHLANKRTELSGSWDVVVLQDYSTLEKRRPGDATAHIRDAARLAALFKAANPNVRVLLETTWPRADMVYPAGMPWSGRPIWAMASDLADANAAALRYSRDINGAIPVGEAWVRAMRNGTADPNPYDGIAFGKLDLWTWDHYHASAAGYYLAALVIFGRVTGADPRRLGPKERAADELGMSGITAVALQRIAYETLTHSRLPEGESGPDRPRFAR